MDILKQCQKWNEENEFQKIIDALEAIPAEERTPEMDSELARAYSNLADPHKPNLREMLKKALALLKPHEEYFEGDHCWNFRMGYAYYYLDQEGRALRYFEKALEARPGDEDTKEVYRMVQEGHFPAAVLGVFPGTDGIGVGSLCQNGSPAAADDGRRQGAHPQRRNRGPNGRGFEPSV